MRVTRKFRKISIIFIALVIIMGIFLAGCQSKKSTKSTNVSKIRTSYQYKNKSVQNYKPDKNKQAYKNDVKYIRHHLTKINTNQPLPKNGKLTIVFFRHDCPHCQLVVPKFFAKNRPNNRYIQYRDIASHPKNYNMSLKFHVAVVPDKIQLVIRNGKIVYRHSMTNLK